MHCLRQSLFTSNTIAKNKQNFEKNPFFKNLVKFHFSFFMNFFQKLWQNKQFLGTGEFTLPFGDYDVKISVPTDHIVAATGELVNAKEILSSEQIERLEKAKNSEKEPVFIVNETI